MVAALAWVGLLLLLFIIGGVLVFLQRGDPERAGRLALGEVTSLLEPGERVVARAPVWQRLWWDHFRHTYGILAATDRRLVWVGVSPTPLVHRDGGPLEMVTASFPYARGVSATHGSTRLGLSAALRIDAEAGGAELAYGRTARPQVDSVVTAITVALDALRAAAEAERQAAEAAAAEARKARYHAVAAGEALDAIARRYGVPVESLLVWNRLLGSRIVVGQRLLVKPETPAPVSVRR